MNLVTGIALNVVLVAAWFYVLYLVIKAAVTAGIRGAQKEPKVSPKGQTRWVTDDDASTRP